MQSRVELSGKVQEKTITLTSEPLSTSTPLKPKEVEKRDEGLEQRVNEYEKIANEMIKKLDQAKEEIKNQTFVIENILEAATLISQGDTLILETHGKSNELSKRLVQIQNKLRSKYNELKTAK